MKIAVKVRLKPSILDTQGKAVHNALIHLGFDQLEDVRIGKWIELNVADYIPRSCRKKWVAKPDAKLLANPVIEDFELVYLED
ncbi:MAG: phosphoribosylformylglycinamidine synthase subunit PurS [Calditrichia bacterium]